MACSFHKNVHDLMNVVSTGDQFSKTLQSPVKANLETREWLNFSFPVLCNLLDSATAKTCQNLQSLVHESSEIVLLKDLFKFNSACENRSHNVLITNGIPVYESGQKFMQTESRDSAVPELLLPTEREAPCIEGSAESPVMQNKDLEEVPDLVCVEYHNHGNDLECDGMLQLCTGPKESVYEVLNNKVRVMDEIIINPEKIISMDAMEFSCELELPGPFSYPVKVKEVKFGSTRYVMDVLGLLVLLIDTIYATNSVSYGNFNGILTAFELSQNIVKVMALIKAAFPEVFYQLQKLIMYSQVSLVLKKSPFKWNRCMVHVLEDLIVHPLSYISEDTIELKVLTMIVRKRAKVLFKMFTPEKQSHIFNSEKHCNIMNSNFTEVYSEEIIKFLKTSATSCQLSHRIKNIRYKVKDKLFESFLRDLFYSYC